MGSYARVCSAGEYRTQDDVTRSVRHRLLRFHFGVHGSAERRATVSLVPNPGLRAWRTMRRSRTVRPSNHLPRDRDRQSRSAQLHGLGTGRQRN